MSNTTVAIKVVLKKCTRCKKELTEDNYTRKKNGTLNKRCNYCNEMDRKQKERSKKK